MPTFNVTIKKYLHVFFFHDNQVQCLNALIVIIAVDHLAGTGFNKRDKLKICWMHGYWVLNGVKPSWLGTKLARMHPSPDSSVLSLVQSQIQMNNIETAA